MDRQLKASVILGANAPRRLYRADQTACPRGVPSPFAREAIGGGGRTAQARRAVPRRPEDDDFMEAPISRDFVLDMVRLPPVTSGVLTGGHRAGLYVTRPAWLPISAAFRAREIWRRAAELG
jgi:hypothetical protein